MNRAGPPNS